MRSVVKYIVQRTYKPVLEKYLSKTRTYVYKDIRLQIPPEVFHPGFFFSTKLLIRQLGREDLNGKTVLEPGAGSGLISIYAARKGASVTSTDINAIAIKYLEKNANANCVKLNIIHSDLFEKIPEWKFDYIIINPPYYKGIAVSEADHAWICGENGEYFQKLFSGIENYIHSGSKVLMVLCSGCDLEMVHAFAKQNSFRLNCIYKKTSLLETNFIFTIERDDNRK